MVTIAVGREDQGSENRVGIRSLHANNTDVINTAHRQRQLVSETSDVKNLRRWTMLRK
jgi:hypothetical protein